MRVNKKRSKKKSKFKGQKPYKKMVYISKRNNKKNVEGQSAGME